MSAPEKSRDRPGFPLHLDPLAGQVMEALAVDLHGGHHGRHLQDLAHEPLGRPAHVVEHHRGHVVDRGDHPRAVEGAGLHAELDLADVGLAER